MLGIVLVGYRIIVGGASGITASTRGIASIVKLMVRLCAFVNGSAN